MATVEKRLQADGTVSFRAKIRIKGALPQTASFARLTDARKWAQSAEAAIREGRHFGYQETKRHTVSDLIDRYARDVLRQDSPDVDNRKRQLVWWKGKIGHLTLADITPALIAEHRDKLLKEPIVSQAKNPDPKKPVRYRSNSTVVRYLAAISHAFTIAIKEWQWLENNPVQRIRKPKEARGRDRFLSDEERTNLLESCKASECAVLYTIVVLALSTGMRRGEIMTLNWKHVDFKNKAVRLEQTKNGDIGTDCISEGQNLQDCDYLINYDIHWNPVRIIQRFGRIDRIGSQNASIQLVNYWPDITLDEYINLKERVENRMVIADMAATADDNVLNTQSNDISYRKEQLRRLQEEVIEMEDLKTGVSITDLGLNDFRMDLLNYIKANGDLANVPTGKVSRQPFVCSRLSEE